LRRPRGIGRVLLCCLAAGAVAWRALPGAEPTAPEAFSPVAPAAAIHAAIASNLKILQGWLDDRDYASAAQTAEVLVALVRIYRYQSEQPEWREQTEAAVKASAELVAAAKRKDAEGCRQHVREFTARLSEAGNPSGTKTVTKDFRPPGSTKTWMLLVDGAYVDAKGAATARELQQQAYTVAEGANVIVYLRPDERWREAAREVRALALAVATQAEDQKLDSARAALKVVYQRCEACHERYQR
jgi:hypothetical protein